MPRASGTVAQGGVRGATVDSARRTDLDSSLDDAAPAAPQQVVAPRTGGERDRSDPPIPVPPMVVTPEQEAADAAYAELQKQAMDELNAQLASQRSALRKACGGGAGKFSINASFDPGGKLLALGISDVRGPDGSGPAGDLGQCVRSQALDLKIAPPGQGVSVEVPLAL